MSKISFTKVSDKMAYANNVDIDQTVLSKTDWSGSPLFTILLILLGYFKKQLHKKQALDQKVWNKVFKILDIYRNWNSNSIKV